MIALYTLPEGLAQLIVRLTLVSVVLFKTKTLGPHLCSAPMNLRRHARISGTPVKNGLVMTGFPPLREGTPRLKLVPVTRTKVLSSNLLMLRLT